MSQLPGLKEENILLEPMRRNTLPSAIWATMEFMHRNPQAKVLAVPSDQIIENEEAFEADVVNNLHLLILIFTKAMQAVVSLN